MIRSCSLLLMAALSIAAPSESHALQPQQHAQVALLADHATVTPGQTLHAGLRIVHDPGWHTYWINPGDSGLATRFTWTLPPGGRAGDIQWPAPQRLPFGDLINLGYKGDLLLPVELQVPTEAAIGSRFTAGLHARWLICADICIPDEARLTLDLPVGDRAVASSDAARFDNVAATLPRPRADWTGSTRREADGIRVAVNGAATALRAGGTLEVYPKTPQIVTNARITATLDDAGVLRFTHPASEYFAGMPATVDWVLVQTTGSGAERAFDVTLRGEDALATATTPAPFRAATAAATTTPAPSLPLWTALLFALLGGVILNLMPCVFPVLALKALAFSHGDAAGHRRHAIVYTVGVLAAFLALAAVLVALRSAGEALGWGFQLQTPWFVAAMALLMAGVGFALSGLATPGAALMGIGQSLTAGDSDRAAFFTGVLAVVVASPCTAPFMGPALGFALTQSGAATAAVFVTLGLGLALPLLIIGMVPALAARLPRPGAWMERLKQALAFPMYLTALWLAWVLGRQVGVDGMALLIGGIVLLGFALWWRGPLPGGPKRIASAALILLALSPVVLIAQLAPSARAGAATPVAEGTAPWEPWSPERVAALRAESRPVLVNFTAAWCISCLANERVALSGDAFEAALREHNVAYLKADWTDYDAAITTALAEFGRSGVPLYLVYPADGSAPAVLPQLLTPATVEAALRDANRNP